MLALAALTAYGMWALLRRRPSGPATPEPWDDQVAIDLEKEETLPLCHRCLSPHGSSVDFCSECGAPVGQYTNLLPYPYLFSIGHTLRIGTAGEFNRSPLTVGGFLLLGFTQYAVFAPVYWVVFLWNLFRRPSVPPAEGGRPEPGVEE